MDASTQIVTVSFLKYQGTNNKWKAFGRMGQFKLAKGDVPGLTFYKLLGSGAGNGFSVFPDFGTYSFIAAWKSEAAANAAFSDSNSPIQDLKEGLHEWKTIYMQTMHAHGKWDGLSPFVPSKKYDKDLPVGVITRGRIKLGQLASFWSFVPKVSRSAHKMDGLIFSKGVGELPFIQQATFSLWENSHYMIDYAYNSKLHKEVVKRTRDKKWYSEDMFARFYPYREEGNMSVRWLKSDA